MSAVTEAPIGRAFLNPNREFLEKVHAAALRILVRTGVGFRSREALEILDRGGARVDGDVAHIDEQQVAWALSVAPRSFGIYNLFGERVLTYGSEQVSFAPGAGSCMSLDWHSGQVRPYTLADAVESVRLIEGLPQIALSHVTGVPSDMPPQSVERVAFAVWCENSIKPLAYLLGGRQAVIDIMRFVTTHLASERDIQERPFLCIEDNTTSPLVYDAQACDRLILGAGLGLPVGVSGWPQLGATGPVTVAGCVAVAHAEHLAGLVLTQLAREGTRFVVRGGTPVFDMRAMVASTGAPERMLGNALLIQLGRFVGLPVACNSVCTDSKFGNVQSGAERAMNCLSAAMAGATIVGGLGWLDNLNIASNEMLVVDCEVAEAVRRMVSGVVADEETLALDAVARVGQSGNYLEDEHTLRHFREAVWYPKVWERSSLPARPGDESALQQRVRGRIQELLEAHQAPPMSARTRSALEELKG